MIESDSILWFSHLKFKITRFLPTAESIKSIVKSITVKMAYYTKPTRSKYWWKFCKKPLSCALFSLHSKFHFVSEKENWECRVCVGRAVFQNSESARDIIFNNFFFVVDVRECVRLCVSCSIQKVVRIVWCELHMEAVRFDYRWFTCCWLADIRAFSVNGVQMKETLILFSGVSYTKHSGKKCEFAELPKAHL